MLTRLTVVLILQYIGIFNDAVQPKAKTMLYVEYISLQKVKKFLVIFFIPFLYKRSACTLLALTSPHLLARFVTPFQPLFPFHPLERQLPSLPAL